MLRLLPGRLTQVLIVVTFATMLVVAVQLLIPAGPSAAAFDVPEQDASGLPSFEREALNPPALAAFSDMLERPLFFAERRMPEPDKAEPPPPPTPLRLKLIGVAISGGSRVALLRSLVNNQLMQLVEGDTHDGWTLDALSAQSASFSRGPQSTELPLQLEDQGARRR
jgi:hypothetical protein